MKDAASLHIRSLTPISLSLSQHSFVRITGLAYLASKIWQRLHFGER